MNEQPCITRIGTDMNGAPFVVYLSDGKKITVGRHSNTKGPAWLEITEQAKIVAHKANKAEPNSPS